MIIKTKILTIIIALTIILTVGITTAILMKMQNDRMIASKLQDTEILCDVIERTLDSAMREGNTAEMQRIPEIIGKSREILSLRILYGTVLKSTKDVEIGSRFADFLNSYFGGGEKPRLLNETTINYFYCIKNRPECFRCHDSLNGIVGFIQTTADLLRGESVTLHLRNSHKPAITIHYKPRAGLESVPDLSSEINRELNDIFSHGKPVIISCQLDDDTGIPECGQKERRTAEDERTDYRGVDARKR